MFSAEKEGRISEEIARLKLDCDFRAARRIDNFTDNFGSGVKQAALNVGRFGSTATIGLFLPQLSAC